MTDRFAQWRAPAHWQAVDFISDLHLQAADPVTLAGWLRWLQRPTSERADALVILGDLFEVWVGDDVLDVTLTHQADHDVWRRCAQALQAYSRDTPVYFMAGNRDFLLGAAGLKACGMQALNDPTVLHLHGQRWLLSHGDALCLADADYMRFREQVRSVDWQAQFLAQPLPQREALARQLRQQSEARKREGGYDPSLWADLDTPATVQWLQLAQARCLIHGHTHRPTEHDLGNGLSRVVLSDWDLAAQPPRAQVLRLDHNGYHRCALKFP